MSNAVPPTDQIPALELEASRNYARLTFIFEAIALHHGAEQRYQILFYAEKVGIGPHAFEKLFREWQAEQHLFLKWAQSTQQAEGVDRG